MGSPYRSHESEARKLEPDHAPARLVRRAAAAVALLGASIGATTPVLGVGAAALGGGVALLGLFLLREATNDTSKAPCPSCGAPIGEIDPADEAVPCPACAEYAGVKDRGLIVLRDEHIASTPLFSIRISADTSPVLPPICAECGAPDAKRLVPVEAHGQLGATVVLVPHCDRHTGGAEAPPGTLQLCVRSYAFWLATSASKRATGAARSGRAPATII